jgi:uncharacterized membrane protein YccF (DUF307 family)
VGGVQLCITIIGTFGVQAFKLAVLALAPFGRVISPKEEAGPSVGSTALAA